MQKHFIYFNLLLLFVLTNNISAQNGIVRTYYDNGNIKSESSYINDILDGLSLNYYENGNIKEEIPLSFGKVHGVYRKYFQSGIIEIEKAINQGVLDGLTKIYYENGTLKQALNYDTGKLIKKINVPFDSSYVTPLEAYLAGNRQYKLSKESNIAGNTEICAVPINGVKDIQNNLILPQDYIVKGISKTIQLSVSIDSTGKVGTAEIIKGIDSTYNFAMIKAVEKTKFLPGRNGNKNSNSKIIINMEVQPQQIQLAALKDDNKIAKTVEKLVREKELKNVPVKTVSTINDVSNKEVKEKAVPEKTHFDDSKNDKTTQKVLNKDLIVKDNIKSAKTDSVKSIDKPANAPAELIGGLEKVISLIIIPPKAIEKKISGNVDVQLEVDSDGYLIKIKLIKGLEPEVDDAVITALIQAKFKAAIQNGQAVKAAINMTIPFNYLK